MTSTKCKKYWINHDKEKRQVSKPVPPLCMYEGKWLLSALYHGLRYFTFETKDRRYGFGEKPQPKQRYMMEMQQKLTVQYSLAW